MWIKLLIRSFLDRKKFELKADIYFFGQIAYHFATDR